MIKRISAVFVFLILSTFLSPISALAVDTPVFVFNKNSYKIGDVSNDIKELQKFLNTNGYTLSTTGAGSPNNETNYFGPKTRTAVVLFQAQNGLKTDGVVGPVTKDIVIKKISSSSNTTSPSSVITPSTSPEVTPLPETTTALPVLKTTTTPNLDTSRTPAVSNPAVESTTNNDKQSNTVVNKQTIVNTPTPIPVPTSLTDSRDGQSYPVVQIGDQLWTAKNMAYLPSVSPSSLGSGTDPYYYVSGYQGTDMSEAKTQDTYTNYGVFYNNPAALTACPSGSHLPTNPEWLTLISYATNNGYSGTEGNALKALSPLWNGVGTDSFGFNAVQTGYRKETGVFNTNGNAFFWSSTPVEPSWSIRQGLMTTDSLVTPGNALRTHGYTVRCVLDNQVSYNNSSLGKVLGVGVFNFTQIIKNGSKGNEVTELQKFLKSGGYYNSIVDGIFGQNTKSSLIKFQIANGLKGDGTVGPITRGFLNKKNLTSINTNISTGCTSESGFSTTTGFSCGTKTQSLPGCNGKDGYSTTSGLSCRTVFVNTLPKDKYNLTYTAGSNGTLTGTPTQQITRGDTGTSITAVPNANYHFVNWSDGGTANPRTDTNVTGDISVIANFTTDTHTVTYTANANGSITGTSPQTVNYGSDGTTITAVPNANYHFVNWSDSSISNPRTDTNIISDISVTANFAINTYTLTYTAGAHGSLTGSSPQTVNYNTSGSAVTAVPNSGYHFVNWSDLSVSNPRTDASVASNITVTANFSNDIVDARDGNTYPIVTIGTQVWTAKNMAYLPSVSPNTSGSTSTPFYYVYNYEGADTVAAKATSNYTTYGVLYNSPASMTACPSGAHLPSDAEWATLITYLTNNGHSGTEGTALKASATDPVPWDGTNNYGFNALLSAYRKSGAGGYSTVTTSFFWSAYVSGTTATQKDVLTGTATIATGAAMLDKGYFVRCLAN